MTEVLSAGDESSENEAAGDGGQWQEVGDDSMKKKNVAATVTESISTGTVITTLFAGAGDDDGIAIGEEDGICTDDFNFVLFFPFLGGGENGVEKQCV